MPNPVKTYLTLFFDSSGSRPSVVHDALLDLGFRPTRGPHDYAYDWGDAKELSDVIWFADRVHEALAGHKVLFKLETVG